MNLLMIKLLLIHTLSLLSTTIYVTGHLKNAPGNKNAFNVGGKRVLVKVNKDIIAQCKTDKAGNFSLSFIDNPKYISYDFFLVTSSDTLLLRSISSFDSDSPELTFFVKTN